MGTLGKINKSNLFCFDKRVGSVERKWTLRLLVSVKWYDIFIKSVLHARWRQLNYKMLPVIIANHVNRNRTEISLCCWRFLIICWLFYSRKPPNWWGSAKRDASHPRPTVVYNTAFVFTCSENVSARPCIYSHMRFERNNNTKISIYATRWRRQVHLSPIFGVKKQKCL